MKALLLLAWLLACSVATSAQTPAPALPVDPQTKHVTYSEFVQLPGTNQGELYSRSRLWLAGAFRSAKDAVQLEDKEASVVSGKGWQQVQVASFGQSTPVMLWYKVQIATKDGRYMYVLSDFAIQYFPTAQYPTSPMVPAEQFLSDQPPTKKRTDTFSPQFRQAVATTATQLSQEIKAAMEKPAAGTLNGKDW
jgi:hypothetical protein